MRTLVSGVVFRFAQMSRSTRGRSSASASASTTPGPPAWHRLDVSPEELRVTDTLQNGQCFGWTQIPEPMGAGSAAAASAVVETTGRSSTKLSVSALSGDDSLKVELVGVVGGMIVGLQDFSDGVCFRWYNAAPKADPSVLKSALIEYFQLGTPLAPLLEEWGRGDSRLAMIAPCIPGLRVLRQDPTECLFSFLCSSNNNISRITLMLGRLRTEYGAYLGKVHGLSVYAFPTISRLAAVEEAELRALGFGYRAPFVTQSAQRIVANGGVAWLESLRPMSTEETRAELCTLHGVGRKVADCVAVFSLDSPECVPCDTHVFRIACRDMDPSLAEVKSLTPAIHTRVNDLFIDRFGSHAGWAHSLLFAAELPKYSVRLPAELQAEMEQFREEGRRVKAERKRAASESPTKKKAGRPDEKKARKIKKDPTV